MAKKAVKKYFHFIVLVITLAAAIFTIVGLFGGNGNPASGNTARAMLTFALPLLIILDLILLVFWLCMRRWHWAVIPLIAVICTIGYIRTIYFPGAGDPVSAKVGLKVATYNVASFGREASSYIAQDILTEMKNQNVDVLCLQEYRERSGEQDNNAKYKSVFPYMVKSGSLAIFSRYPISKSQEIAFEQTNNGALYADIKADNRELRIFNVHMQTTGINSTLHQAGKLQKQGKNVENSKILKAIYGNYTLDLMVRSGQANIVANEVRQSTLPVILCGDFNDVPYSYVYKTLKGNMKDGFTDCGSGWMKTYRGNKPVRIDYIFYDKSLNGINYYKKDLTYSDHVPVFADIQVK